MIARASQLRAVSKLRHFSRGKVVADRRSGHGLRPDGNKVAGTADAGNQVRKMLVLQCAAGEILDELDSSRAVVADLKWASEGVDDLEQLAGAVVEKLQLIGISIDNSVDFSGRRRTIDWLEDPTRLVGELQRENLS